jgi:hypothetical protein
MHCSLSIVIDHIKYVAKCCISPDSTSYSIDPEFHSWFSGSLCWQNFHVLFDLCRKKCFYFTSKITRINSFEVLSNSSFTTIIKHLMEYNKIDWESWTKNVKKKKFAIQFSVNKMDCIFWFFENRSNKIMIWNLRKKLITVNKRSSEIWTIIHFIICVPTPVAHKCAPATLENYYNEIPKTRYCTYTMIKPYKLPSLN